MNEICNTKVTMLREERATSQAALEQGGLAPN